MIRAGLVRRNGEILDVADRIDPDTPLTITLFPEEIVAEGPTATIVYRDDDVVVVDKPAGLVVHPATGYKGETLVEQLIRLGTTLAGGEEPRPGVVHRLDGGTSGLMVLARTPAAYLSLSEQIRSHEVVRIYWALVHGKVERSMVIDAPIGRDPRHRHRMAVVASGRPAQTEVTVVERMAYATLIHARLRTGRTHQIRVHMATAHHPVVGDTVYGGSDGRGLHRPALHAMRLEFRHPTTGVTCILESVVAPALLELGDVARSGETV